jgi:hypothetical protein
MNEAARLGQGTARLVAPAKRVADADGDSVARPWAREAIPVTTRE